MMHMLVASDGAGGGEMHPYAASVPAEQELELHRDNADDSLDGHVRYVLPPVVVQLWYCLVTVGDAVDRRNGLAFGPGHWLNLMEQLECTCSSSSVRYLLTGLL